jgi:hypothetical protein
MATMVGTGTLAIQGVAASAVQEVLAEGKAVLWAALLVVLTAACTGSVVAAKAAVVTKVGARTEAGPPEGTLVVTAAATKAGLVVVAVAGLESGEEGERRALQTHASPREAGWAVGARLAGPLHHTR